MNTLVGRRDTLNDVFRLLLGCCHHVDGTPLWWSGHSPVSFSVCLVAVITSMNTLVVGTLKTEHLVARTFFDPISFLFFHTISVCTDSTAYDWN